jgi:subtilisin family serine protease
MLSRPLQGAQARVVAGLVALAALAVTPFAAARVEPGSTPVSIVVGFEDDTSRAERLEALADAGVRIEDSLPKVNAVVVSAPHAEAAAALAELRGDADVAYAARETTYRPALVPNDPGYTTSSWPYLQTALPNAWDLTTGTSSVIVAVLDSGVDATHPDLPAMGAGYDVVNDDAVPADDLGHGTQVTGALAARLGNGLDGVGACPGCTVMPVKVISGVTGIATDADIVDGIVWATDHGADVINMSLGGPDLSELMTNGVAYARSRGVVVIASAGNDGTSDLNYPAAIEGVVSVAGVDSHDWLYTWSNRGASVDVAAPGCLQTTLLGGGSIEGCGTSIAAPLVSGIAGLVLSRNSLLNAEQVTSILTSSARDEPGLDVEHGIVDANVALHVAGATPPPPANTALPQVSGTLEPGQTLTSTTGSWSSDAISYSYAWERCNASTVVCARVQGATASTYTLSGADVGLMLRSVVTATNGGGARTSAASAKTAVVGGTAPATGSTDVFVSLTSSTATPALNSNVTYTLVVGLQPGSAPATKATAVVTLPSGVVHVSSSASRGTGCTAKGQKVTCELGGLAHPQQAEVVVSATVRMSGKLTVHGSATTTPTDVREDDNVASKTVTVAGSETSAPPAPNPSAGDDGDEAKIVPVSIGGTARVGKRLTVRPGSGWAGEGPHRFRYQWQSCAPVNGKLRCGSLKGKTARILVVTRSYVGKRMRVLTTGIAADGTTQRRSSRTTTAVRR